MRKYEVTIKEKKGSCESPLFEKMAKNGDITSTKVKDVIGKVVKITGYALCNIVTEDRNFDITYYATENCGILSSGSEVFKNSVDTYLGDTDIFRIVEVKTKKGNTYKAVPELSTNELDKKEEESDFEKVEDTGDLPF